MQGQIYGTRWEDQSSSAICHQVGKEISFAKKDIPLRCVLDIISSRKYRQVHWREIERVVSFINIKFAALLLALQECALNSCFIRSFSQCTWKKKIKAEHCLYTMISSTFSSAQLRSYPEQDTVTDPKWKLTPTLGFIVWDGWHLIGQNWPDFSYL